MLRKISVLSTLVLSLVVVFFLLSGCQEKINIEPSTHLKIVAKQYPSETQKDTDSSIYISKNIVIPDKGSIRDSLFSYPSFENFLLELKTSGRFMFVTLNELDSVHSEDKVIIALRHDIDYDIDASVRFARREHQLGISGTYYVLHTADYYTRMEDYYAKHKLLRNPEILDYLIKIQNEYNHEIGWHNDLLTLLVHYNINACEYLRTELKWLRSNNLKITGTSSHGSHYCYTYHYLNGYFWKGYGRDEYFYNYDSVPARNRLVNITKYDLSDFGFSYEANLIDVDKVYADVFKYNGRRWHMNMVDWNSIPLGSKIILIIHPALWDSY